jgi:hypothetical protein
MEGIQISSRRALSSLLAMGVLAAAALAPQPAGAATCGSVTLSAAKSAVKSGGRLALTGACATAGTSSATAGAAASTTVIQLRARRGWSSLARRQLDAAGAFSAGVRVRPPRGTKVATLRALTPGARPSVLRVGVFPACAKDRKCLRKYGKKKRSRGLIASDTASNPNPIPFWGNIDCENASRHAQYTSDGDPSATGTGAPQGDDAFRRTTVFDGDDYWGERCELGANSHKGPVAFYREGQRRITHASFRLPSNFPLDSEQWQGVLQMKQAQPAENGGGTPVISLSAFQGTWSLWNSAPGYTDVDHKLWEVPAQTETWTRFMFDVRYSQDPKRGSIALSVDANGDGDFDDAGERSPVLRTNTLKREIGTDTSDGLKAGASIPSHLRVGMYHHEEIPCPPPSGCSVDVDNVQVVAP